MTRRTAFCSPPTPSAASGALNGALFADEVDFFRDYLDEARRYYCNIVGKYGNQVQALLKKAAGIPLNTVCPLHGFVWRRDFDRFVEKYQRWSTYTPEERGVAIAYASIYGNTANAADLLAVMLRERGVKTTVFDVSVTAASEIIAAAFRYSHLVLPRRPITPGSSSKWRICCTTSSRTICAAAPSPCSTTAPGPQRQGSRCASSLAALPETTLLDETVSCARR